MFLKLVQPSIRQNSRGRAIFVETVPNGPKRPGFASAISSALAALFFIALLPLSALAADNTLVRVGLGAGPDYTRLSFTFQEPVESYTLRRDDVDQVVVEFKAARQGRGLTLPQGHLVDKLGLAQGKNDLKAEIQLAALHYEVRHFISNDKLTVALDFKDLDSQMTKSDLEAGSAAPLVIPALAQEAGRLLLNLPVPDFGDGTGADLGDGPALNLYRRILGRLVIMDNPGALADMNFFLEKFPKDPLAANVNYLLAELTFFSGPPEETYLPAAEIWRKALDSWPDNELALRAQFMQAEADRLNGHNNEAAAKFKILADDALDDESIYKRMALLRAVDLLFSLGMLDEGRAMMEPILEKGVADRLGLEAYARSGMADFYQGFFSQANETFLESLKLIPGLYLTYPEMLYAAGEGYHYLNRPDLSRRFLFHALNLMPDHPKADVIMARIGDDYRREGRDREAMAVYGAATRNYPHGDGGLISQVRLADMGALHSFFTQDKVFDGLERGTRQATVEMYKKIAASGSHSPLAELAQLKIGTALAEDGENAEAIKWLRDIEINNPRSALLPEVLPTLSRALAEEVALRKELEEWKTVTDLWADNSSYLSNDDKLPVMRSVAEAYEKLGQTAEARDVWREMAPESPEEQLNRLKHLVELSRKLGQNMEALDLLQEIVREFPRETEWVGSRLSEIGRELAKPADAQAASNLIKLADSTNLEPARKTALADAIELDINAARYDRALELINRYRQDYPEDSLSKEYILTQAEISRFTKKPDQAWAYMDEFRRNSPDDPRAGASLKEQIAEAEELGRDNDALKFMALYRRSYPEDPDNRSLLLAQARKEWEIGRYDDSRTSFETFLSQYPEDPDIPELMHQRALDDWDKGRHAEARATWDELRRLYPDNPLAGKSYVDQYRRAVAGGLNDEASDLADKFREARPNDPAQAELMLEEAKDLLAADKAPEAVEAWSRFRSAYPNDPRNPDLLLIQARQEMKIGRNTDALGHYQEFLNRYPDNPRTPDVFLELAAAETKLNQRAPAREHLDQFNNRFRNHPGRSKALLDQVELSRQLGLIDEAVNLYQTFRRDYPQAPEVPATFLAQARLELGAGRNEAAIRTLEEGMLVFPALDNDKAVQGLLTDLYLDDGQVEKWAAIVERNLNRADAAPASLAEKFFKYSQLAQVYQKLGRNEDAERNFDTALANKPPNLAPESLYAIAKAYKEMNLTGKYSNVLTMLASSSDPMWKSVAEKELSELSGG